MKRLIFLLSLILGLILFIGSIQQAGVESVIQAIKIFPISAILAVFFINFTAIFIVGTLRWKIIIEAKNSHKTSFNKLLRAKLAGFTVSYITPSVLVGGEPVRAYIIKEESGYGWEKSFASVLIDQAIYFFSLFLFMVFGFLFLAHYFSLPVSVFYGFGFIIATSLIIFYLFYSRIIKRNSDGHGFFIFIIKTTRLDKIKFIKRKLENIKNMENIIAEFFNKKNAVFAYALLLALLEVFLYVITVWLIIQTLGETIDLAYSSAIFFIITLANFIPIPGSLGSFETSLLFIFDLLNLGKSNGFAFSLIFRLINIVLVLFGFLTLVHFSIKTLSNNFSIETPKQLLRLHQFLIKFFHQK